MAQWLTSIAHLIKILLLAALMSFIIFGTTAYFFAGPTWGLVAFAIGLVLLFRSAKDAVEEQTVTEKITQTTGFNAITSEVVRDAPPTDHRKKKALPRKP